MAFRSLQTARSFTLPTCSSCLQWIGVSVQQVRGAKKLPRSPTITVQLLQDVPKFGRKGAILPVARGRMRSIWFPRGMARYLSNHDMKNVKEGDIITERDVTFRPDLERKKGPTVVLDLLTPEQSHSLLEAHLPETIEFARSTKSDTDNNLHGSISIADLTSTIRSIAAAGEGDVSRVVVKSENITFVPGKNGEIPDKIQLLGTFLFKICLKEGLSTTRKVVVTRQASAVDSKSL